ncbi:MAG: sterol desaturase family protein [Flavitalea sp.]
MELPDISNPFWFLVVMILFFAIIIGRYFLASGLFYLYFYIWFPKFWQERKIGNKKYTTAQLRKEIRWSMFTAVSFSFAATFTFLLWQKGYTKVYTNITKFPWWWLPLSLGISMMIDETYYYWVHRWLHRPSVFKKIHRIHHQSNITSPWTAFAFHPIEGLMLSVILPITLMIVPMHPFVILVQLSIMTISSVINHLDIEIYPEQFHKHMVGRWLIGATHHSLHHKQFKFNYGLYFTFWDKWKKTESPLFDSTFESATAKKKGPETSGISADLKQSNLN